MSIGFPPPPPLPFFTYFLLPPLFLFIDEVKRLSRCQLFLIFLHPHRHFPFIISLSHISQHTLTNTHARLISLLVVSTHFSTSPISSSSCTLSHHHHSLAHPFHSIPMHGWLCAAISHVTRCLASSHNHPYTHATLTPLPLPLLV